MIIIYFDILISMREIIADERLDNLEREVRSAIYERKDFSIAYPLSSDSEMIRYSVLIPIIGLVEYSKNDMDIKLIGFPLCVFPQEKNRWMSFVGMITSFDGVFADKCSTCNFKDVFCKGVPKKYLEKFGDDELTPGSTKSLAWEDLSSPEAMKSFWETSLFECGFDWDYFFKDIPGKILDVGTGFGAFVSFAPDRIIGVDKNPDVINNAMKETLNLDLRENDARSLKFPDNTFDGVHSRYMLEHMTFDEAKEAVSEMIRVLKPGGKIFISAAGPYSMDGGIWGEDTHFSRDDLKKMAEEGGLTKYRSVRGDLWQPFFYFNFEAEELTSTAKEIAVLLIGEK